MNQIDTKNHIDEYEKNLSISAMRMDLLKQNSVYQGTSSARRKQQQQQQQDAQTVFEGDSEIDSIQWDSKEKERLAELRVQLKNMKDRMRAHDLVMNLPSRMLKNLDQNKFNLLSDNAYNDELIHIQEIAVLESRQQAERLQQQKTSKPQTSIVINSMNLKEKELCEMTEMLSDEKHLERMKQRKSSGNMNRLIKNQWKQISKMFEVVLNSIPIVQPSSRMKLIWDILNIVVTLICMFYLPITIIFDFSYTELIPNQLLIVLPNILVLDILVNLNTGYFDKGQVVKNRLYIIYFYWKKNVLTDIISVIPFIISLYVDPVFQNKLNSSSTSTQNNQTWIQSPIYKVVLMAFFLKAISLSQTLKKIEERFNLSSRITNLLQLMKLLFTIIMISHLFACLWVYVANEEGETDPKRNWMGAANIQHEKWYIKYLTAYYFTTVTMITVGYGDILPRNEIEMILCVITMMLACGVFGYSLNEVGIIFSNFFQVDNEIKKKIGLMQRFMSKKSVGQRLQYEIREYLEYYWRETAEMNQEQEQHIISQLSESLRQKLMYEANKIVFKDSPIFKRNFSKSTMEQIVPLIQEIKYTPESFICLKGIQDDAAIYFIENGSVEILLNTKDNKSKSVFLLTKGESFGAHTFFTGLHRMNNVRSKEFTTILKIRRQDFLQLIQSNSEDYETFCSIRDSISYLNDYSKIGLKCVSCNSYRHLVNECQYLHYIPNKPKVIKCYKDHWNVQNTQRNYVMRRKNLQKYYFKNSRVILREVESQAVEVEQNKILPIMDEQAFLHHEQKNMELSLQNNKNVRIRMNKNYNLQKLFFLNYQNDEETQYSDGYFDQTDYNENLREVEGDDDKNYLLIDKKSILKIKENNCQNQFSPLNGTSFFINQPRTLKSRQLLDATPAQTINCIDIIEEDEQGENGEQQHNMEINKPDKGMITTDKIFFQYPTNTGNNQSFQNMNNASGGACPIPSQRSSSKRVTETQFSIPTIYRSNTTKSEHQNGSVYSQHNQYQNTNIPNQPHLIYNKSGSSSFSQEDQLIQDLLGSSGIQYQNQMSPSTQKRNALRSVTKRLMNAQKMYDPSQARHHERRSSKQIHFEELGSPTSSIKQQFQNKKTTSDKMVSKLLQTQLGTKSIGSAEQKNLETMIKQLQQLMVNQQNYQQLQLQLDNSNNNNHPDQIDRADLFIHFDKMKLFVKYNPRFNFQSVISRYNQFIDSSKKKTKNKNRASKIKGTQYKQSQKNLELLNLQLDARKFSKFSPSNFQKNHHLLLPDNGECSSTQKDPSNLNKYSEESFNHKDLTLKLDQVQNQTAIGDSMNQLKSFNFGSSQNIIQPNSPHLKSREAKILNSKQIDLIKNLSLTIDEKDNKTNWFAKGNTLKFNNNNKNETVENDDVNSPSLHMLPNYFDMRFSNLGLRSLQDYEQNQKK